MKYLVHLVGPDSRQKTVLIEASDSEKVKEVAAKEFPSHEVGRMTSDQGSIEYFENMKEIGKIGNMNKEN